MFNFPILLQVGSEPRINAPHDLGTHIHYTGGFLGRILFFKQALEYSAHLAMYLATSDILTLFIIDIIDIDYY